MPPTIKPRHFVATAAGSVADTLVRHFRQEPPRAAELLGLGAITLNGQRLESDSPLKKGDHLQIHLTPTRFPVEEVDWKATVVAQTEDYLVVRKPSGIPVHATPDNLRDNVLFQLRALLGETLLVTQRLDAPVSGLMVLAKTQDFQREFNGYLSEGKVAKTYRALTVKPVPKGRHVHFLNPDETTPRQVSAEAKPQWQRAELEILDSRSVLLPASHLPFTDVTVRLITGRTHQIRAQLGALGAPVVGDKLYRSTVRYSKLKYGRGIALAATELAWPGSPTFKLPPPWSA